MTQAIDDYKTEVDADGAGDEIHEESADGIGVGGDANAEVNGSSGGVNYDVGSDSYNGSIIGDDIGSVDDGILGGSGNSIEVNWLTFESTAYIALCDTGCTGVTFTGVDVRSSIYYEGDRVIAVDPAVIPLGSRVEIRLADGATFTARAIDTGGAINGHIIDLLVATEAEAWAFGRQSVELRILGE